VCHVVLSLAQATLTPSASIANHKGERNPILEEVWVISRGGDSMTAEEGVMGCSAD
jgi:hypothetical protein